LERSILSKLAPPTWLAPPTRLGPPARPGQPGRHRSPACNRLLLTATLATADHRTIGQVFLNDDREGDRDGWLYVSVDAGPATRKVICQLLGRDGQVVTIGSFGLRGGYGYWGSPESMRGTAVVSARLLGADGHVLGSAAFDS
jgi:hypothetical protein